MAYSGSETKKNSKETIIISRDGVYLRSGGWEGVVPGEPGLLYYLGNSYSPVLTCANELQAPFFLYFIPRSEKHYGNF